MNTQLKLIKAKLRADGQVSRNWLLQRFISRGAARIDDLRHEGWKIDGKPIKTPNGRDYLYVLVAEPAPKQMQLV